jgi:succinate dehydrogenase hydrophobic anchor subunit
MSPLNKVCFVVCIVTIIISALLGLAMIWTNIDPDISSKTFLTCGIFFLCAIAVAGVNAMFGNKTNKV